MSLLRLTAAVLLSITATQTFSADSSLNGNHAAELAGPKSEKGWFFFEEPPKKVPAPKKEEEEARPPMPTEPPPPPKEDRCKKKESWSADCGFVNPGKDFDFQAKQRDALMQNMAMSNNDPKAVEAFQYYMRWVLERTSEVTNLWWYNMVQNPELDPTVQAPVSAFGLRLMTDVKHGHEKEIFSLVKEEGGTLIVFSRNDCQYCHQMVLPIQRLSSQMGLEVRNASLDDKCIPAFKDGCMTAPASLAPAQALQVTTVPTVFLYIKPNTWLRIGTGVVDTESMRTRAVQFFSAYRNAMLKGVENGQNGRASVDFGGIDPSGVGAGAPGTSSTKPIRMPNEDDISQMLGKTK